MMFDQHPPLARPAFDRRFRALAGAALLAATLVAIHAALAQRALYADGAHYLLTMIDTRQMTYPEASRQTIHMLQQWPAFALLRTGVGDMHALSVGYSLTVYLLPVLFTAACFPLLPDTYRNWFLFPLLDYLAGSTAAGFPGILEGPVATAYFWLIFYAVTFLPESPWCKLATALIAIPAAHVHEVFSFLAPLLAFAAAARARRSQSSGSGHFYYMVMLWFLVVTAVQLRFVLAPIVPAARDSFFAEFIRLVWLLGPNGKINVPAALGLLALAAMLAVAVTSSRRGNDTRISAMTGICTASFGCLCLVAAVSPFLTDLALFPGGQFAARNQPAFLAVPFAVLALASVARPAIQDYWTRGRQLVILAFLAVGTLGWQAAATVRWMQFTDDFRTVLEHNKGLVPWMTAMRSLPEPRQALFHTMSWPWTNPTLSILLSRSPRIATLIANPEPVSWQPFDPADPERLPRSDLFDTRDYQAALARKDH